MRLHITNGDSTVPGIRALDGEGTILPWRDVLHEGPVPGDIGTDLLAEIRSAYISRAGYSDFAGTLRSFHERNDIARRAGDFDEIVLWFEHDLYDQLQILEILAFLAGLHRLPPVTLICIESFAGVERFVGLGQLDDDQLGSLFPLRSPVTPELFELGKEGWRRFRAPVPNGIDELARRELLALPFLRSALRRLLRELPDARSGLSETESIVLASLTDGPRSPYQLFSEMQAAEASPFLGDASFWLILSRLAIAESAAVSVDNGNFPSRLDGLSQAMIKNLRLSLTDTGRRAAAGEIDFVKLNGIDRWQGGVHLHGNAPVWRWDRSEERVTRR